MLRAESIQTVDKPTALTRAKALMWFIDRKLVNLEDRSHLVDFQEKLKEIPFLPIMQKPEHFPIVWKGWWFSLISQAKIFIMDQQSRQCEKDNRTFC